MKTYRISPDGTVVCQHRDLSCCETCLTADDAFVDVLGAVYYMPDPAERAELLAEIN